MKRKLNYQPTNNNNWGKQLDVILSDYVYACSDRYVTNRYGYGDTCRSDLHDFISTLLQTARKEAKEDDYFCGYENGKKDGYNEALNDMFLEICDLAEPDERQFGAGDLHTNLDEIHKIREKLQSLLK